MAKVLSLVAFAVLASAVAVAREDNPIRAKLDKAMSDHAAAVEKVKEMAEKAFTAAEDKARGRRDGKKLDQLAEARKAFDAWLDLPEEDAFKDARIKLNQSRRAATDAHTAAIKEYTKAGDRAAANQLVKDLNQLQESWDALKAGSIWTGKLRWVVQGAKAPEAGDATMTITDRQGTAVTLKVVWEAGGKQHIATVEGKVETGKFRGGDRGKTFSVEGRVVGDRLKLGVERPAAGQVKAAAAVLDVTVKSR
ncbi:MAG: hypothetical protein K2X87_01170 [Gemmataceae bacterium]|nr:hypothetical protein [Gemmataceae bacterium]